MRRVVFMVTCLATMGMLFTAAPALAANAHFTSGPTSSQNGGTLQECATIAGLGSTPTDITLSCQNVTFQCMNKNGNIDNAHQSLSNTTQFQPHNGTIKNACVSVTASCPDHQTAFNANFGSCTYTVLQNGVQVLP